MEKATIIFNDGTEIEAAVNGDCFIVDEKPDFPDDLTDITIVSDQGEKTVEHGRIVECASEKDYWFAIVEIPEAERTLTQMQANIEYMAMMTDVDLEEV